MSGPKKKSKAADRDKADDKSKQPTPKLPDDDLYETGDIAGPVRDRNDEDRDL